MQSCFREVHAKMANCCVPCYSTRHSRTLKYLKGKLRENYATVKAGFFTMCCHDCHSACFASGRCCRGCDAELDAGHMGYLQNDRIGRCVDPHGDDAYCCHSLCDGGRNHHVELDPHFCGCKRLWNEPYLVAVAERDDSHDDVVNLHDGVELDDL